LCEKAGVALCMENLPSWEAIPNELEAAIFIKSYNTPFLRYWHDIGHAVARERMRWTPDAVETALRLLPMTAGVHIHDVKHFSNDHQPPGQGQINFKELSAYGAADVIRVLEPGPDISARDVREGLAFIKKCWDGVRRSTS